MRPFMMTIVALMASLGAFGQPAFEVVSVKPTPDQSREPIGLFTFPGGRIRATKYTLRMLIHDAYQVEMYQILGGPRWVDGDRFDVEAKPPSPSESAQWIPASFKTPPSAGNATDASNLARRSLPVEDARGYKERIDLRVGDGQGRAQAQSTSFRHGPAVRQLPSARSPWTERHHRPIGRAACRRS